MTYYSSISSQTGVQIKNIINKCTGGMWVTRKIYIMIFFKELLKAKKSKSTGPSNIRIWAIM